MDLDKLTLWDKVAATGGLLGILGFALPWFEIFGEPRSGLEMIVGSGSLSQHATPALLMMWGAYLGLLLLSEVVGTGLALSPAVGRARRRNVAVGVGVFAAALCALLLVAGFRMGVGYWAAALGAVALALGGVKTSAPSRGGSTVVSG